MELQLRIMWALRSKNVDVYAAVDLDTILAMWLLSRWKGKELLFDAHEIFEEVPELIGRPWVRWVWKKIAQWCIPSAKYCWTVNQSLANILGKRYKKEFTVIRNLPEMEHQKVKPSNPVGGLILYQGRLNQGRGLDEAIIAMKDLPEFHLVLAGGGDIEQSLRELVHEQSIPNVEITGNLDPEELREWTQKAWVGLNLLDPASGNYYFSLANKFFDYMAFGVPSITMDFPEYRHINNKWEVAILLWELSPKLLVDAIRSLDENPSKHKQLADNARIASQELNWEKESKKMIRSLVGDPGQVQ